jgi:hypothetical protein
MEHQFVVADGLSDEALNSLINAAQAQICQYSQTIYRLQQIEAQAKLKLLAKQIEACDE